LFAGVILIPAIAYKLGANPIGTFWFAYIITRPLGASFADWMDYPTRSGGLGWGTAPVWSGLAVLMIGLVAVLAYRERRPDLGQVPHVPHVPHIPHVPHPGPPDLVAD
jgi:uncharacterized membrane-anchored protein